MLATAYPIAAPQKILDDSDADDPMLIAFDDSRPPDTNASVTRSSDSDDPSSDEIFAHVPAEPEKPVTTSEENPHMGTAPALDPRRTAMLVMDYQPTILATLTGGGSSDALLGRVENAITDVRAHGGTIAYVRVGFTESDWEAIPSTNKTFAAMAQHRLLHDEHPDTAIYERLAPLNRDIVVRKTRYGAMSTTDLDSQLRERGITTLIVSGITTSGVVLSTVIDAADRDYQLYVLSDGIADPDIDINDFLLHRVFPARAHIIDTNELYTLLRND